MICRVSKVKGTAGRWKGGKPPLMLARSPTVLVGMSKNATSPNTARMATREAGTALVSLGSPQMMSIVSNTSPPNRYSASPVSHAPVAGFLNWSNCAMKMMIARPLTNPKMAGWGTRRISFPSRSKPAAACSMPARMTVAKMYSIPCEAANETMTTATAPVAPEIIPGRPPSTAVTIPITKAAYSPVSGGSPARNAKATASGTSARATVSPERISMR